MFKAHDEHTTQDDFNQLADCDYNETQRPEIPVLVKEFQDWGAVKKVGRKHTRKNNTVTSENFLFQIRSTSSSNVIIIS